MQSMWV